MICSSGEAAYVELLPICSGRLSADISLNAKRAHRLLLSLITKDKQSSFPTSVPMDAHGRSVNVDRLNTRQGVDSHNLRTWKARPLSCWQQCSLCWIPRV